MRGKLLFSFCLALLLGLTCALRSATADDLDYLFELPELSSSENAQARLINSQRQPFSPVYEISERSLTITIQISDGAYIYRDSLKLNAPQATLRLEDLPAGVMHEDFQGESEVYFQQVVIKATILSSEPGDLAVLHYQGCDSQGICYPPAVFSINLPQHQGLLTEIAGHVEQTIEDPDTAALDDNGLFSAKRMAGSLPLTLAVALLLGIGLDLTPCVLPMLSIFSAFIMGSGRCSFRRALLLNLSYLLGLAFTYTLIGLAFSQLGVLTHAYLQNPYVLLGCSALFLLFALDCAGLIKFDLPFAMSNWVSGAMQSRERGTVGAAALFGALSALLCTPCTSAPLAGALLYVLQTGDILRGTLLFLFIGLGMGLPLFCIGLFGAKFLPRHSELSVLIRRLMAVPLFMAAYLISNHLLGSWRYTVGLAFWGLLAGYAVFCLLDYFKMKSLLIKGWVAICLAAATAFVASALTFSPHTAPGFTVLEKEFDLNAYRGRPVIVTFAADWCVNCHQMDLEIYGTRTYAALSSGVPTVRFDFTDPDNYYNEELARQFKVVGVPYALLLNKHGEVVDTVAGFAGFDEIKELVQKAQQIK